MTKAVPVASLERIELERLRARVAALLAALQDAAETFAPPGPGAWLPPVDLCERGGVIVVEVELPGVRAEQIEVTLTNSQLRVGGRKRRGATRGVVSHLCSERSYGQFERVVPLRWPVRAGEARAELRDGVLTIRLPKLTERRGGAYKVPVKEQA